jgi:hypothetical protein
MKHERMHMPYPNRPPQDSYKLFARESLTPTIIYCVAVFAINSINWYALDLGTKMSIQGE